MVYVETVQKRTIGMVQYAENPSPIGPLLLECREDALTGLWMNREIPDNAVSLSAVPVFRKTKIWLDAYFQGEERKIDFPLAPAGTPFQRMVWQRLLEIPYGKTDTYGNIAREMALLRGKEKMSAQAVGQAVGRNPISILIPCHRCLGAKGQLTGYAGGLDKKRWLLRHEGWKGDGK